MSSNSNSKIADYELVCIIVNYGFGSKVIREAKKYGVSGGTVLLGKGTVNNRLLKFLALDDVRKEIIYMASDKETVREALEKLDRKFKFSKPNHGIVFTTSISHIIRSKGWKTDHIKEERGVDVDNIMYHSITVIVEKGNASDAMDAAIEAGSKGGTVINARGSGIHETTKLFAMEVEPEKEVVIILSERDSTESIVASISKKLKIDEPGNGIIFVQDVNKTYGIYK